MKENGRGDKIRTCDPLVPNQMRYQAAPLPDMELYNSFANLSQGLDGLFSRKPACLPAKAPKGAKDGGPGGTRTPDLAVMSGQL
jgi:hypothetical protein